MKLIIRNIFKVVEGYANVSVDRSVFDAVRGVTPSLEYKTSGTLDGKGARIFTIDGAELISVYNREARNTMFFIEAKEAQKRLVTLVQERANEVKLPFNTALFSPVAA